MKPLRAEFSMTPEDLAAAVEAVADRDAGVRAARRKAQRAMCVLLLFLVGCVTVEHAWHKARSITLSMGCLGGAVVGLVLRFPTRNVWRRAMVRQSDAVFATPAGKACLGHRSVEVGPDGIAIGSRFARTLVTWRGVFDVFSTGEHLVAILPGPVYLAVPRRAFDTDGDFGRFGETVTELAAAGGGLAGRVAPSG